MAILVISPTDSLIDVEHTLGLWKARLEWMEHTYKVRTRGRIPSKKDMFMFGQIDQLRVCVTQLDLILLSIRNREVGQSLQKDTQALSLELAESRNLGNCPEETNSQPLNEETGPVESGKTTEPA